MLFRHLPSSCRPAATASLPASLAAEAQAPGGDHKANARPQSTAQQLPPALPEIPRVYTRPQEPSALEDIATARTSSPHAPPPPAPHTALPGRSPNGVGCAGTGVDNPTRGAPDCKKRGLTAKLNKAFGTAQAPRVAEALGVGASAATFGTQSAPECYRHQFRSLSPAHTSSSDWQHEPEVDTRGDGGEAMGSGRGDSPGRLSAVEAPLQSADDVLRRCYGSASGASPITPLHATNTPRTSNFASFIRRRTSSLTSASRPPPPAPPIVIGGEVAGAVGAHAALFNGRVSNSPSKPTRNRVVLRLGGPLIRSISRDRAASTSRVGTPNAELEQAPRRRSLDVSRVLSSIRTRSGVGSRADVGTALQCGGAIADSWEMIDGSAAQSAPALPAAAVIPPSPLPPSRSSTSATSPSSAGSSHAPSSHYRSASLTVQSGSLPPSASRPRPSLHIQRSGGTTYTSSNSSAMESRGSSTASRFASGSSGPPSGSPPLDQPFPAPRPSTDGSPGRPTTAQRLKSLPRLTSYGPSTGAATVDSPQDIEEQEDSDGDDDEEGLEQEHMAPGVTSEVEEGGEESDCASVDGGTQTRSPRHPGPPPTEINRAASAAASASHAGSSGLAIPSAGLAPPRASRTSQAALTWVTFAPTTPTPHSTARPPTQSEAVGSYFDLAPASTPASAAQGVAKMPQTPGERALAWLLSPATGLPPVTQGADGPARSGVERPSTAPRRSQSVLDIGARTRGATAPNGKGKERAAAPAPPNGAEVQQGLASDAETVNGRVAVPPPPQPPSPAAERQSRRPSRRQSMYELRSPLPPPYQPSIAGAFSTRQPIQPREEEGREGLPQYTCAVHLEGWMPRKMEFKSPGVQAKDRAWKRQYVILHGTMIRIYRADPHVSVVPGEEELLEEPVLPTNAGGVAGRGGHPGDEARTRRNGSGPLHFHQGQYGAAPSASLKEVALAKASHLPTQHNALVRLYGLQDAESGLAADYLKRKHVVRVRAEGEQFLLAAKDDRGVIDLIEALQAATNVALDLDQRPLPKFITLPRRRRRRRRPEEQAALGGASAGAGAGAARGNAAAAGAGAGAITASERMGDMLAEEQEAYARRAVAAL